MPDSENEVHHYLRGKIDPLEKAVQEHEVAFEGLPSIPTDPPATVSSAIPTLSPSLKRAKPPKKLLLSQTILGTDAGVRGLLNEMRSRSGVSFRVLAKRMGVVTEDVKQYFNGKRGSSRTSIGFLVRFAEACGCRLKVEFPERGDD